MRRSATKTEPRPDQDPGKRELILDAARQLFAERGFFGTPVEEIASVAGVGAGTVYRYFTNKEAMVNALFQREKMRFAQNLMLAVSPDKSTREQFHDMWHGMARYVAGNKTSVAFMELHHHADYIDSTSRAMEEHLLAPFLAFIQDAQRKKVLKDIHPQVIAAIVYGAFVGLVKFGWQDRLTLDLTTLSTAEDCVWEAIRA